MTRRLATITLLLAFALLTMGQEGCSPETDNGGSASEDQPAKRTARLSNDAFTQLQEGHADWAAEVGEYADQLGGKCATLASAGQMSEFFDCEDDAYDGIIGQYANTEDDWKELRGQVKGACRSALGKAVEALNGLADSMVATHETAQGGGLTDGGLEGEAVTRFVTKKRRAYDRAYVAAEDACAPR